jgi:hypothetical protein
MQRGRQSGCACVCVRLCVCVRSCVFVCVCVSEYELAGAMYETPAK